MCNLLLQLSLVDFTSSVIDLCIKRKKIENQSIKRPADRYISPPPKNFILLCLHFLVSNRKFS